MFCPSKGLENGCSVLSRFMKGVSFFDERYTKGEPVLCPVLMVFT